jgi:hypothetical protein
MIGEKFLRWMDGVDVHVVSGNLQIFGKWKRLETQRSDTSTCLTSWMTEIIIHWNFKIWKHHLFQDWWRRAFKFADGELPRSTTWYAAHQREYWLPPSVFSSVKHHESSKQGNGSTALYYRGILRTSVLKAWLPNSVFGLMRAWFFEFWLACNVWSWGTWRLWTDSLWQGGKDTKWGLILWVLDRVELDSMMDSNRFFVITWKGYYTTLQPQNGWRMDAARSLLSWSNQSISGAGQNATLSLGWTEVGISVQIEVLPSWCPVKRRNWFPCKTPHPNFFCWRPEFLTSSGWWDSKTESIQGPIDNILCELPYFMAWPIAGFSLTGDGIQIIGMQIGWWPGHFIEVG